MIIPEQWKTPRWGFYLGDLVKVVREYDHKYHTVCYRQRVGKVDHFSGATVAVNFTETNDSPRPDFAWDVMYFTPAQLKILKD